MVALCTYIKICLSVFLLLEISFFFYFQLSGISHIVLNIHVHGSLSTRVTFIELLLCFMWLIASQAK